MRIQSPTISLTTTKDGQTGASAFVHIKYSDDGQTFTGHDGEDIGKFMGIYTDDVEQDSTTFADYTWNKIVGDDAYTVVLTNENFSFAVDSNRKPLSNQSVQTGFIVFRGTQQVTNFTIGTVTPPTGISYSELNGVITFSVSTATALAADSGSILIPINITSSLTIQKYATWSLSYKGNTGDTGGKGDKGDTGATVSIQKDQYYLSTSNIELLGDTWHDGDPPSIPAGKYLWTRVENTMTDGTIVHSNAVYKSTIQGLVSDVDNVKGSITNKVWESDITSELTAYDGGTSSVTNTVRDRVSQTEQDITGITSRVGAVESTTTGLSTRMTTAESNISQNADNIELKVSKDGVISSINQSSESVQINANKVNINGAVTFSSFNNDLQNRFTTVETDSSDAANKVNNSIKQTTMHYLATAASTGVTRSTSGWTTTIQSITSTNRYLWTYQTITKVNDSTTYTDPVISGVWGNTGTSVTITGKSITYAEGTSGTTAPSSGWGNTIPSVAQGKYLWTKTIVNYSDGNSTTAYSVAREGANGTNGVSPTVTNTAMQYAQSTNGSTPPSSGWQNTPPTATAGQYMWTKTTLTYSDGATSESYSVSKNGANGGKGDTGIGVTKVEQLYRTSSSTTAPAAPTSLITSTSTTYNTWTLAMPTYNASYPYYYTCTQTQYTEGNPTWSSVARSKALEDANTTAAAADGKATTANNWITNNGSSVLTAKDIISNWAEDATSATTTIKGGLITTNTITADQLATDAIMSSNYVSPTASTTPFSASGSFLNLANGDITTPSFSVDHSRNAKIGNNTNYVQFNGQTGVLSANVSSLSIAGTPAATSTQVNDARKVATNYLYYNSTDGLVVHQNGTEISSVSDLTGNVGNVRITGDGMDIYRGQTKTASYGSEVVIGPSILSAESPSNIRINTNGFQYNNGGDEAFYVGVEQRVVEVSEESTQNAVLPEDTVDRIVANDEYVYVGDLPPNELRLTMEVDPNVPEEVIVCNSYLDLDTYTSGGKTKYIYKIAELPLSNHLTLKRLKPDSVVRTSDGAQMEYEYHFAEELMDHDEIWVYEDYHVTYRMITYKAKYNFISGSTFKVIQESNINPGYYDLLRYKIDNDHVLAVLNNANDVSFIYRANSSIIQVNGLNYFRIGTNSFNKVEVDANDNIVIKGYEHRRNLSEYEYEHTGYETKIIDNTTYYKAVSDSIIYSRNYYIDGFSDTAVIDGINYYKIGEHPLSFSLKPNSVQYKSYSTHGSGPVQYYTVTKTDTYEIWAIDYIDVVYTIYTNEKTLSINAYYNSNKSSIDYVLKIDNNIYTIWVPDYHGISVDVDTIWTHYGLKHSGEIQIVDGQIYTNHYQNYFINNDNGATTSPSEDVMLVASSDTTINSNTFIERAELATRTYYKVYDIPENVIVKSVVKSSDHSIAEYYIQDNGLWVADDYNVIYTIAYVGDTTSPYFVFGPNNYSSALPAGKYSFAAGEYCSAQGSDQFVIGKYNERKTSPAFIIGNGEADNNRSNALEIDWHGNVMTHGSLYSENVMTYGSLYSENDDITATEINNYVFG